MIRKNKLLLIATLGISTAFIGEAQSQKDSCSVALEKCGLECSNLVATENFTCRRTCVKREIGDLEGEYCLPY